MLFNKMLAAVFLCLLLCSCGSCCLFCLPLLTIIQHPLLCNCWIQIFIIWTCWSYDIIRLCWAWQAFGAACKLFRHGTLLLLPNRKWDAMWLMWGASLDICFHIGVQAGEHGLSQDLQGEQAPEAVSEGRGLWPATEVAHSKEEQPDQRRR